MTPKPCIYKCGTMLEGWDDEAHKYKEASTGGLHTKERCQEAKNKKEQKDDHGNEQEGLSFAGPKEDTTFSQSKYIDHTLAAKPTLKLKIFTDPSPDHLEIVYNNFADFHNIKFSQYQLAPSLYTIAAWYEDKEEEKA